MLFHGPVFLEITYWNIFSEKLEDIDMIISQKRVKRSKSILEK